MSRPNSRLDAEDFFERHRPAADDISEPLPRFPWLALFLATDIMLVFAVIWYFVA
ncbi:MAG TPA: hypothetical protein VHY79_05985 [Rhizomicrobium sp.]|jgi:hypothetical protein|nr:hypothetical protein [Rhizomicrobium sp.]